MRRCHNCGSEWVSDKRAPGFKEYCEACSAYLHCCLNCALYDPTAPGQCQSHTTELVADKQGLNFCDEFDFAQTDTGHAKDDPTKTARKAFEQLFDSDARPQKGKGSNDFDKLFGD